MKIKTGADFFLFHVSLLKKLFFKSISIESFITIPFYVYEGDDDIVTHKYIHAPFLFVHILLFHHTIYNLKWLYWNKNKKES